MAGGDTSFRAEVLGGGKGGRAILSPGGSLGNIQRHFWLSQLGKVPLTSKGAEVRDVANHPMVQRTVPQQRVICLETSKLPRLRNPVLDVLGEEGGGNLSKAAHLKTEAVQHGGEKQPESLAVSLAHPSHGGRERCPEGDGKYSTLAHSPRCARRPATEASEGQQCQGLP